MKVSIHVGEPQPVPCETCNGSLGYQYGDLLQIHYTSVHSEDGAYKGGAYSDFSRTLNKATIPFCANCGGRLKFKLTRKTTEEV